MVSKLKKEDLLNLIEKQQQQIESLLKKIDEIEGKTITKTKDPYDVNRLVTVIHMDDLVDGLYTVVKGDSEYRFNKIGDKHRIRLIELEKIMSNYKHFFTKGILIIAEDDINEYFSIDKSNFISIDVYRNIYKLSIDELKELYESVCDTHKDMILRHWFFEFEKGENPAYRDYGKISILNQCSNNKLRTLIDDFNSREMLKNSKK